MDFVELTVNYRLSEHSRRRKAFRNKNYRQNIFVTKCKRIKIKISTDLDDEKNVIINTYFNQKSLQVGIIRLYELLREKEKDAQISHQ